MNQRSMVHTQNEMKKIFQNKNQFCTHNIHFYVQPPCIKYLYVQGKYCIKAIFEIKI